jgi:hypothetical protein
MTDTQCFKCRGLNVLVEMAKEPEYRGPKIVLCKEHILEIIEKIGDSLDL